MRKKYCCEAFRNGINHSGKRGFSFEFEDGFWNCVFNLFNEDVMLNVKLEAYDENDKPLGVAVTCKKPIFYCPFCGKKLKPEINEESAWKRKFFR
jgi:hypothetical protein